MLKLHYDQFIKPSKEQNVCRHQPNQIKCTGNTLFLNKTDSHKIYTQFTTDSWETRLLLHQHSVLFAWRLDREMRRQLILHETGFTH